MSRGSGETADDIVADGEKLLPVFCLCVSGQAGLVVERQVVYVATTSEGEVPDTERVLLVFRDIDGHILIGFCLCAGKRRVFIAYDLPIPFSLLIILDQNEKSVNQYPMRRTFYGEKRGDLHERIAKCGKMRYNNLSSERNM